MPISKDKKEMLKMLPKVDRLLNAGSGARFGSSQRDLRHAPLLSVRPCPPPEGAGPSPAGRDAPRGVACG